MHLGYLDDGHMTTYYPGSKGITKEEIAAVDEYLVAKKLVLVGQTKFFKLSTFE